MRGGLPLFRFRGIQVFLHWTFLLLPAYIIFVNTTEGSDLLTTLSKTGGVFIVFGFVVLHEFGHALTAQYYGINTRDITLLPIGGIASLERMPDDPKKEFWITFFGPFVNLFLASVTGILIFLGDTHYFQIDLFNDLTSWPDVASSLFMANLGLLLFNLIPAFPMDGGRILRSLLSMRMGRTTATRIATVIGRVFAVCFVVFGLYSGAPVFAIIGLFIFMAAGAEARVVQQKANVQALRVGQRVRTDIPRMAPSATVQDAWNAITMIDQHVVLVMDQGLFRGLVMKEDLRLALGDGRGTDSIASLTRHVPSIAVEETAMSAYEQMLRENLWALMATSNGSTVGVVLRVELEKALGSLVKES